MLPPVIPSALLLLHILENIIPAALFPCTYCLLSYPSHTFSEYSAPCHALPLLSCTYCPLLYHPHSSPAHTAHCYTFHTPLLNILPFIIPSTLFFCTYCPLSYLPHSSPAPLYPPHSSSAHTSPCYTIC
ncbi:unnamed protein product, partial [Staurois parvus]